MIPEDSPKKLFFKKLKFFQKNAFKIFHFFVDNWLNSYYTIKGIEAWLSLVERCVRDAEVASSNLVASTYLNTKACWSSGQDDALSRRKPGFDSRSGHLDEAAAFAAVLFF